MGVFRKTAGHRKMKIMYMLGASADAPFLYAEKGGDVAVWKYFKKGGCVWILITNDT